jgi:hypothetical protein
LQSFNDLIDLLSLEPIAAMPRKSKTGSGAYSIRRSARANASLTGKYRDSKVFVLYQRPQEPPFFSGYADVKQ